MSRPSQDVKIGCVEATSQVNKTFSELSIDCSNTPCLPDLTKLQLHRALQPYSSLSWLKCASETVPTQLYIVLPLLLQVSTIWLIEVIDCCQRNEEYWGVQIRRARERHLNLWYE
jgi:hypothetical protein